MDGEIAHVPSLPHPLQWRPRNDYLTFGLQ